MAFWASRFGVEPPSALQAGVTLDLDFFGTMEDASSFAQRLDDVLPYEIEEIRAEMDDHTPDSAKILIRGFHERDEPVEIDYLRGIFGFVANDESRLKRRAMTVVVCETKVCVMHPLDCLRSRVSNLSRLPGKQTSESQAQCRLAVTVTHAYFQRICDGDTPADRRASLNAAEQVADLACSADGIKIKLLYDIDLLRAVPVQRVASREFREKRWPQILKLVERNRTKSALRE